MPTYEYECGTCGLKFERWQGINDASPVVCPDCSGKVKRLVSGGIGFILKRSGGNSELNGKGGDCLLEQTGRTCCGRNERCGKASCEGET
ncbi:MAG TPA: zinc ribbon domain-containing protein [Syntrophales bacterium]|mgnify:CR=1 FL=1|jgi:putative FmdB family regulatory protein|nr:zinc ribbon domain-containing protein [Syntrophales bacterium]HPX56742.1 zinc ribbon domain-containing protein [Syntrophales bacterium]